MKVASICETGHTLYTYRILNCISNPEKLPTSFESILRDSFFFFSKRYMSYTVSGAFQTFNLHVYVFVNNLHI